MGIYIFFIVAIFLILQLSVDIIEITISNLGRDMTLTGRTELWKDVLAMRTNPLIGTGYESFWLGDRAATFWEKYPWHPNQAHNGYLETYINLGSIGLFLLIGVIFSSYRNIVRTFIFDFDYGIFRMAILVMILLFNLMEASFKGIDFMWFIFLLIAVEYPRLYSPQRR